MLFGKKKKPEKDEEEKKDSKKGLKNDPKKSDESGEEVEEKKRKPRPPAEGSRFGALVLLAVSVLVSIGFYLWGVFSAGGFEIDLGDSQSTWEYEK